MQKTVPVKLLELGEGDGLLEDKQVKQFVMDLSNPRQGAKLGRYPRTTITIADKPGIYQTYRFKSIICCLFLNLNFNCSYVLIEPSVVMFKKSTQTCNTSDPLYSIPVVRTRNQEGPTTVYWRTNKASRFDLSSPLKFAPGETEKNIVIDPRSYPSPIIPETFQLELFDPSNNAIIGERKTSVVNVIDGRGEKTGGLESVLGVRVCNQL